MQRNCLSIGISIPLLLVMFIFMLTCFMGCDNRGLSDNNTYVHIAFPEVPAMLHCHHKDDGLGDSGFSENEDAAAHKDLHLHPYVFFWNGTTKGTGSGFWVGTGWDGTKTKRKLFPVPPRTHEKMPFEKPSRIQISPGGATPGR